MQRVVQGKVELASGSMAKGAIVYIKNAKTLEVRTYISTADGSYRFGQLNPDANYTVWAEYQGKKSKEKIDQLLRHEEDLQHSSEDRRLDAACQGRWRIFFGPAPTATPGTISTGWNRVLLWRDLQRLVDDGIVERVNCQSDAQADSRERDCFREPATGDVYVYVTGWERGSPEFRKQR